MLDEYLSEDVHLDACPVEDECGGPGDLLLPEGSGASCVEDDVGDVVLGDLLRPPVSPVVLVSAVGVVVLLDAELHGLVGAEGSDTVLDEPGPDGLPKLYEGDLGVADCFAVSAAGTFVDGVHEVGVESDLPFHGFVEGSADVDLVEVVDLSPGGDGFPRSLNVGLADGNAVSALYAGGQFLFDVWELGKYVHSNTFFSPKAETGA